MRGLVLILVAIVLAPALTAGQWLKYPTDGIPRKADGTPNLAAPAPRLADGRPDLTGLWHASNPNRCVPGTGQFVECGAEIGGSPRSEEHTSELQSQSNLVCRLLLEK